MDLAEQLEISQSHYAQFESGRKTLSMNHILKLLEILQMEILPKSSGLTTSWVTSFLNDTNSSIEEVISNLEQLNSRLQENMGDTDPIQGPLEPPNLESGDGEPSS